MAMHKKHLVWSLLLVLVFVTAAGDAFAGPRRGNHRRNNQRHHRRDNWRHHRRHHRRSGFRFSSPRARLVLVCPPRRALFCPTVVASTPVAAAETVRAETVIVWITNDNGSKSPVTLTRDFRYGPGYIGPRGEYYSAMPTEEQLRVVYGLR